MAAIWDAQNCLIQIWRTRGELTHKHDEILYGLDNLLGCPEWPDPDLAAKLVLYERIGEPYVESNAPSALSHTRVVIL